jgi:hypothetical protein
MPHNIIPLPSAEQKESFKRSLAQVLGHNSGSLIPVSSFNFAQKILAKEQTTRAWKVVSSVAPQNSHAATAPCAFDIN